MKRNVILIVVFFLLIIFVLFFIMINKSNNDLESSGNENTLERENMIEFQNNISMVVNGNNYSITLENNSSAKKLYSLLPLEITMNELNNNEKYYYFEDLFPTSETKINNIEIGDILLYGNNCLVLFYESFSTEYSYTRIGKIDNPDNLKDVLGNGSVLITFTK